MNPELQFVPEKMIFRHTNTGVGRQVYVTPENSTMQHLAYGRIILNSAEPRTAFDNGDRETVLAQPFLDTFALFVIVVCVKCHASPFVETVRAAHYVQESGKRPPAPFARSRAKNGQA